MHPCCWNATLAHCQTVNLSISFFSCCISFLLASFLIAYWKLLLSAKQTKFDDFFICVHQVVNKYNDRTSCLKGWRRTDTLLYFTCFICLFPEKEQFNSKLMRKKTTTFHDFACILKLWCYTINSVLIDVHFHVIAKLKRFDTSYNKSWDSLGTDFCVLWSPDFHHTEAV